MPDGMIIPPKEHCVEAVKQLALDAALAHASPDPFEKAFGRETRAKRLLLQAYAEISGNDHLDWFAKTMLEIDGTSPLDYEKLGELYTRAASLTTDMYERYDHLAFDAAERELAG